MATASELAQQAGVSNATVSRFFRRLGYSNFEAARQEARRMRATGSPLYTGRKAQQAADPISDLVAQEAALIEATLSRLNPLLLPGQTCAEGIAALEEGDLAIVVGLRRRPRDFNETVEAIAARGVKIVLLVDQTVREAPEMATWRLDCVVDTPQFADSYVGAMSVLRLMTIEASRALGDKGQKHLERVEDLRCEMDELE